MHEETLSDKEKYRLWLQKINRAWLYGWRNVHIDGGHNEIFISPSGTLHDLSAADMSQLPRIEREGLMKWKKQ